MHRIFAADVQNPPASDNARKDRIRDILEVFDLQDSFEVNDVADTVTPYRKFIIAPGITIRDRLRVPLHNDMENYYHRREILPRDMMGDLEKVDQTENK